MGEIQKLYEYYSLYKGEYEKVCHVCGNTGQLLCCDFCKYVYHLGCLNPPLLDVPENLWKCPECIKSILL